MASEISGMDTKERLTVCLAGNANVGKSVIFNQLTGLNQTVGNWPGKTVERAEGTLHFKGYTIRVIDLPGTYSLSAYSMEETVARDFIAIERPDVVIDVIDASALERNLYLTIQLLELNPPLVAALNQIDLAAKKGVRVDAQRLSGKLQVPVVPTVATTGFGIHELVSKVIEIAESGRRPVKLSFGREIEQGIERLEAIVRAELPRLSSRYPPRWIATKLIERDEDVCKNVEAEGGSKALFKAAQIAQQLEEVHGESSSVVIASERYALAGKIVEEALRIVSPPAIQIDQRLSAITAHRILGYPILAGVIVGIFVVVFTAGGFMVSVLEELFDVILVPAAERYLSSWLPQVVVQLISGGLFWGVAAAITVVLPYVVPFYILLSILEDSGYLPRAAFLMDSLMHKIGLHGKAFIPLLLGYGCNVPACVGCRIMETDRERFLAGFVVTLVPCAARSVIILGLVGRYIGMAAALALYVFDLCLIFMLGRLAFKVLPGEPMGLIMEMPPYRRPVAMTVLKKTWSRTKDFVYVAFPFIIGGSIFLQSLSITGLISVIADLMTPFTVSWLGLPAKAGIPLIFGVLRKELTLVLLADMAGSFDFASILTPIQMLVFAIVTMIYIPCIATIAALVREFGAKRAIAVAVFDSLLAIFLGGLVYRVLVLVF
jgi:ferrous iron transport protein B